MRFKLTILVVVCASFAVASLGCKKLETANSGEPGTLQVGIITWVGYTPLYVAQEKGFFAKRGLKVELKKIEDSGARRAALASGRLDASVAIIDEFAVAASAGLDARVILKLDDSMGADGIVAKREIQAVQDLKGKTIAFPQGLPSHYFLICVLKDAGLSIDDIEPRYMEAGEAGAAFLAGSVDAAVTWEPWLSKASASGGHVLVTSKTKPGLIVDVMLAHPGAVKGKADDLKKFVEAWFEAVEFVETDQAEAYSIMAKAISVGEQEFKNMVAGVKYADQASNESYFVGADGGPLPVVEDLKRANKVWMDAGVSSKEIDAAAIVHAAFVSGLSSSAE